MKWSPSKTSTHLAPYYWLYFLCYAYIPMAVFITGSLYILIISPLFTQPSQSSTLNGNIIEKKTKPGYQHHPHLELCLFLKASPLASKNQFCLRKHDIWLYQCCFGHCKRKCCYIWDSRVSLLLRHPFWTHGQWNLKICYNELTQI